MWLNRVGAAVHRARTRHGRTWSASFARGCQRPGSPAYARVGDRLARARPRRSLEVEEKQYASYVLFLEAEAPLSLLVSDTSFT